MELQEYLGKNIIKDMQQTVKSRVGEFAEQNNATKIDICLKNKYDLEMYKEGVGHLINMIDNSEADIEQLENENSILKEEVREYKNMYGEVNEEYTKRKEKNIVCRSATREHAKKRFAKYIEEYEKYKKTEN